MADGLSELILTLFTGGAVAGGAGDDCFLFLDVVEDFLTLSRKEAPSNPSQLSVASLKML